MSKLFGSSGVRGLVNVDLTPVLACKVASAVATCAKAKRALVAKDTRVSGDMIEDALISGLVSCGTDVLLAGMVPTPVCAYAVKAFSSDAGFMLTASHNPPQYNGIKVFNSDGLSCTDSEQEAIEKIVAENGFALADWRYLGSTRNIDATDSYMKMALKHVSLKKKWRVVVDPGCGATFSFGPQMLKALGCKVTALNAQPDGHFPARKSEPNAESLQNLSQVVKALGADVGIGFDGDGDRVAFVDERGFFVSLDRALAAYGAFALKKSGGGEVVTNVEASMSIETMAQKYDGKVSRTPVGDVYVSEVVKRDGAVFGGEPCGAWVHPNLNLCPDGPLSAVLFLAALEESSKSVSEFVGETPEYVTLRENVACKNESKYSVVQKLDTALKVEFPNYTNFSTVDGVRLALKKGWLLIRASGTEPLIRLTVEGESVEVAKDITAKATALIHKQIEAQ